MGVISSVAQIFGPGADAVARAVLVTIAISPFAIIAGCYAIASSPHITDQDITVTQPVPFSHEHHVAGLGIDCRYCHTTVEVSAFAGMDAIRAAYAHAIEERYRFFSYGDAMLLTRQTAA